LVEEASQVRMVDGVEVFRDIDVHHPTQPLFHEPDAQGARHKPWNQDRFAAAWQQLARICLRNRTMQVRPASRE
jgi:hypothetical protein